MCSLYLALGSLLSLLLQAMLPSFWVTAKLKGPLAQSSETLYKGGMPQGTNLIEGGVFSMCLHPPAIVCRKQDCRMEAGLHRKRGAQSSFRVRTLITSTSSMAFSGGEKGIPKRPQGSHPDPRGKISWGLASPQGPQGDLPEGLSSRNKDSFGKVRG